MCTVKVLCTKIGHNILPDQGQVVCKRRKRICYKQNDSFEASSSFFSSATAQPRILEGREAGCKPESVFLNI